ncbi:hypothetical protein GW17_00029007 [Ensete ventricosum]|nr:hypothetical protein GW17_00029007 [Ensete ventricosum]
MILNRTHRGPGKSSLHQQRASEEPLTTHDEDPPTPQDSHNLASMARISNRIESLARYSTTRNPLDDPSLTLILLHLCARSTWCLVALQRVGRSSMDETRMLVPGIPPGDCLHHDPDVTSVTDSIGNLGIVWDMERCYCHRKLRTLLFREVIGVRCFQGLRPPIPKQDEERSIVQEAR